MEADCVPKSVSMPKLGLRESGHGKWQMGCCAMTDRLPIWLIISDGTIIDLAAVHVLS